MTEHNLKVCMNQNQIEKYNKEFESHYKDRGYCLPQVEYEWAQSIYIAGRQQSEAEIAELKERVLFLDFLEECGVDNWDGYSDAKKLLRDYKKQQLLESECV